MKVISARGDHKVLSYDTDTFPFVNYFHELFGTQDLGKLHLSSELYQAMQDKLELGGLNEIDTDLHTKVYTAMKQDAAFTALYRSFVRKIYDEFFPDEPMIIYQTLPSVRFQFPESVTIPPHKDSDHLSNHPLGEKNFLVPITHMQDTNSVYIESKPDKGDFNSQNLAPGQLFYFNGNTCTHYNERNKECKLRISIDFRCMRRSDYLRYLKEADLKKTNPRDVVRSREPTLMIAGRYYQLMERKGPAFPSYKVQGLMQHRPTFEKEEADAVHKYMMEDSFLTEFKKTKELEEVLASRLDVKHAIMTTSGTCALMLALMALDLPKDSEVLVPNFTMIATANAVKAVGLRPKLCDVSPESYTLDLENIKSSLSERTRAVIHVSLNNRSSGLQEIASWCEERNIFLLEDSAQSLGCSSSGKSLGTFGKIGCFSLSTPKIISTGQGGICVTDDDELARKMRMIKNFGNCNSTTSRGRA